MRSTFTVAFLFFISLVFSQEAQPVYSITKQQKDFAFYKEQVKLWEKEVSRSPADPSAWMNYYQAIRMNNRFAGANGTKYDLNAVITTIKEKFPNSFEYHYLSFKADQLGKEDYQHLRKAYAIDPDRYETWDAFINEAIFRDDWESVKEFNQKWLAHFLYSPGLTDWNYNALAGLDQDAVLLTFGDNDTYPIWLLQSVFKLRQDVTVINAAMYMHPPYREMLINKLGLPAFTKKAEDYEDAATFQEAAIDHLLQNSNRPVYVGISLPNDFREKHRDNLHLIGLTYRYTDTNFDHVAVLRRNFERHFRKDYLLQNFTNDFCQSVVDYMNQQYIPALTVLYKHYQLSGEVDKLNEVKHLLLRIGQKANRESAVKAFLDKHE